MAIFKKMFALVVFTHALSLLFTGLLRLLLFINCHKLLADTSQGDILLQAKAFLNGLWFDNVMACYVSILPLVVCFIAIWLPYLSRKLAKGIVYYTALLYAFIFGVSCSNIPYFLYFFKNINSSILEWAEYRNQTLSMVTGEYSFAIYLLPFIVVVLAYVLLCTKFVSRLKFASSHQSTIREKVIASFIVAGTLGLCLFGIRGRMGYNPIKVSAAYYCNDPFLNQIGISPTFNLLTSILDDNRKENKTLTLTNEQQAITYARNYLGGNGNTAALSPLLRTVGENTDAKWRNANVVMIFMESMSAHFMERFGNTRHLTPFLDSLWKKSLAFPNFYSAGIHTNHGLYATLYSFPAFMKRNMMKGSVVQNYYGLPNVLKDRGYATMFFMTHESQYDNMNAFFRTNGFEEIYSQENYPKEKVVNGFGVQDDYLFSYALPVLNNHYRKGKKFFAALLSISNHPPYIIPPYFKPRSTDKELQAVEYADWSLAQFFHAAEKQPWFHSTIFVLLGDHGKLVGKADCEMPQSYNHIPLMIYTPDMEVGREIEAFGGQVDVQNTLLGLMGLKTTVLNFGVDLLKQPRNAMFFTADNLIGARNTQSFYIYNPETRQEFFYDCSQALPQNLGQLRSTSHGKRLREFDTLKHYCFNMLQAAQAMVKKGKTSFEKMHVGKE